MNSIFLSNLRSFRSTVPLAVLFLSVLALYPVCGQTLSCTALHIGTGNTVSTQQNGAFGANNTSNGWGVVTIGNANNNSSNSNYNLLVGYNNVTSNSAAESVIVGSGNNLQAYNSLAVGNSNLMRGDSNFLAGFTNTYGPNASSVLPSKSAILGESNTILGGTSNITSGRFNVVDSADYSATFGRSLINYFSHALVVGKYNEEVGFPPSNPPLFLVGNGINNTTGRSNAFVVLSNGDVSASGAIRVNPAGDLSMGQFTQGPQ